MAVKYGTKITNLEHFIRPINWTLSNFLQTFYKPKHSKKFFFSLEQNKFKISS